MWILYVPALVAVASLFCAGAIGNKIAKAMLSVVAFLGFFVSASFISGFILANLIGARGIWLGYALFGAAFVVAMLLVWRPFKTKARRITICCIAVALALTTAIVGIPEIYKNSIPQASEEIALWDYTPFGITKKDDGAGNESYTLVKSLEEESKLQLDSDLPRLDGATALYPLYSAFARATYPVGDYSPYADLSDDNSDLLNVVACTTTNNAFENLIEGHADIAFLMGISDEQRAMADARGLELVLTPIGREAFVFFVNSRNAATGLSSDDIRRIYSGEVTDWQELGGGRGKIRAYQRPEESGSQTMLKQIMGDKELVPAPEEEIYDTMMGMYERVAEYRNYRNSLGYSFLFYIRDMIEGDEVRFLLIDGMAPTRENIASGAYPFAHDFYAVTAKRDGAYINSARSEDIDALIDWTLSPQGQYLVDATGYVSLE